MIKKLSKVGSSMGFIIEKPILELYRVDENTQIEFIPEKDGIRLRFLRDEVSDDELTRLMAETNKQYGKMLKSLA